MEEVSLECLIVLSCKSFGVKRQKTRPQLLLTGSLNLRDNARPHFADVVTKKLRDYGWEVLPQAPFNPDISPLDFDLFPMHGRRFSSLEELSTDVTRAIRHMNKSGVLDGIIIILLKHWNSVIEKQGHYIEGL